MSSTTGGARGHADSGTGEELEANARTASIGVVGTGGYVPAQVRTNVEVAALAGVTPDWIVQRTGIRRRHVLGHDQATSDLAAEAVRRALESAGLTVGDLDLLVLATSTPDELGPATACRVQARLAARQAVALDVSAACSGWMFGAKVAVDWLRADAGARYAAVVGVEAYSRFLDPTDAGTAALFGDGAGATILGPVRAGTGFGRIELGSDGEHADDVLIPGGGSRIPASPTSLRERRHVIHMDGRAVRDFILEIFPKAAAEALRRARLAPGDVDLIVTHQPNPKLLQRACREAGFDSDLLVMVGDQVGNLGAGSIPYALAKAHADGRLRDGDRVLIVAFGAGVTWGGTVLTWDADSAEGRP